MHGRYSKHRNTGSIAVLAAIWLGVAATPARAQIATSPVHLATPGWSFAVTPYAWIPTIQSSLTANGPRGGTVNTSISAGIADYVGDINFTAMAGAQARYGRFTLMTDIVYLNLSLTTKNSHLASVNPGPGPIVIPLETQLGTGTRMGTTLWSIAGGYTLLQGDWGNLDAVVGSRMLTINSTTNYQLSVDILAPNRTIALGRGGSLSVNKTFFNAIGGLTGRINIPDSRLYLPFYADAGGGALPLTWQVYAGIAYQAADWADVGIGYRYLTFQNGGSAGVRNLSLGGLLLTANFRF